jgi:hypothetical protein
VVASSPSSQQAHLVHCLRWLVASWWWARTPHGGRGGEGEGGGGQGGAPPSREGGTAMVFNATTCWKACVMLVLVIELLLCIATPPCRSPVKDLQCGVILLAGAAACGCLQSCSVCKAALYSFPLP